MRSLGYVGGGGGAGALDEPGLPDPRRRVHVYERVQQAMQAQGPAMDVALREMAAIAAEDGGNPFVQMALGHLAYRDGRLGTAERAFARSLELDPDRPGVRLPYGRLLREVGRLEESERQLRIAVEQAAEGDLRTPLSLAETLQARGNTEEAQRIVDAVLAKAPDDGPALAAKARLLVERGRHADAAAYMERAGAGAGAEDWVELAELYLRKGQPTHARESAEHVLRRTPAHPWALALAGHALTLEGKRDAGVLLMRQALALRPRRPAAWLSLAAAFDAAGEGASAARCRRQARRGAPNLVEGQPELEETAFSCHPASSPYRPRCRRLRCRCGSGRWASTTRCLHAVSAGAEQEAERGPARADLEPWPVDFDGPEGHADAALQEEAGRRPRVEVSVPAAMPRLRRVSFSFRVHTFGLDAEQEVLAQRAAQPDRAAAKAPSRSCSQLSQAETAEP